MQKSMSIEYEQGVGFRCLVFRGGSVHFVRLSPLCSPSLLSAILRLESPDSTCEEVGDSSACAAVQRIWHTRVLLQIWHTRVPLSSQYGTVKTVSQGQDLALTFR